jgi:hypothetical protein
MQAMRLEAEAADSEELREKLAAQVLRLLALLVHKYKY